MKYDRIVGAAVLIAALPQGGCCARPASVAPVTDSWPLAALGREMPSTILPYCTIPRAGNRLDPAAHPGVVWDLSRWLQVYLRPEYVPTEQSLVDHAVFIHGLKIDGRVTDIRYLPLHLPFASVMMSSTGGTSNLDLDDICTVSARLYDLKTPANPQDAARIVHDFMQRLYEGCPLLVDLESWKAEGHFVVRHRKDIPLVAREDSLEAFVSAHYLVVQFHPLRVVPSPRYIRADDTFESNDRAYREEVARGNIKP